MPLPPPEVRWDDVAAAGLVDRREVDALVDVYSRAFIARLPPVPDATTTLARLAGRGFALGILSNWPLTVAIERYVAAHGWDRYLRAVVVSERVGSIKPHEGIFQAAEAALGLTGVAGVAGGAEERAGRVPILHVGDDWAADIVGASRAGWRTAYLHDRQGDTPLPTSARDDAPGPDGGVAVVPDLEIDELAELDALVDLAEAADPRAPVHPADP
jgi:FMN phosphatase YigB (HAD superfamily)